jgi:quercetin dioxygenase-like cupin family protein
MVLQRLNLGAAVFVAFTLYGCSAGDSSKITAQNPDSPPTTAGASGDLGRGITHDDQIDWGPAPPIFPAGARFAVVQGNPGLAGEVFTVRLLFPNGYVLPPHTHPADEYVTVLRGTFLAGMGADFSRDALGRAKVGDFLTMPKDMPHFASTLGVTEVQVHGIGPFQLTYVHPEDDPTK